MNKDDIVNDDSLAIILFDAAEIGIRYWRPEDKMTAKAIVGSRVWSEIARYKRESKAGEIFIQVAKELGLVHSGYDVHNVKTYILAGVNIDS
ncbi:hypothetical protein [Marinobacterium lacunae]|uniref:hypothetical protein n=1 Tax=Marinobacterium lacunae TaxID=1232683 RepID=UPI000563D0A0|nr:hypothetical protein [Marinobacterium lacunae]